MWQEKMLNGGGTDMHVLLMGAQTKLRKEECVLDMGQRPNDAAAKDAQTESSKVECVSGMGQKSNAAALKDAQI
jgi:hypothetical protein